MKYIQTFLLVVVGILFMQFIFGAYYNASFDVAIWDQQYKGISIFVATVAIFGTAMGFLIRPTEDKKD